MRKSIFALGAVFSLALAGAARASDHLDTPRVAANPQADIGDLYAWTAPDGRRLNLVMTLVGKSFSDRLDYVFHVGSGRAFGRTTAGVDIVCRFPSPRRADCRVGDADRAEGDAGAETGLASRKGRFRVFAGLRDDPFFNNVKGARAALTVAAETLKGRPPLKPGECPRFDTATSARIFDRWRHTDGGPAKNFLAGWTASSIVVSVDLPLVAKGGPLVAVWAATVSPERQVDRAGRPMTANALIGPLASDAVSDRLKDAYNAATPATAERFIAPIEDGLALYDGYDGVCGDQMLAGASEDPDLRYGGLAMILADDRLWVNTASSRCTQLFAVELAGPGGRKDLAGDCGGRPPSYSAANVFRSLLVDGTPTRVSDGIEHDDKVHSDSVFPFLAPPDTAVAGR